MNNSDMLMVDALLENASDAKRLEIVKYIIAPAMSVEELEKVICFCERRISDVRK